MAVQSGGCNLVTQSVTVLCCPKSILPRRLATLCSAVRSQRTRHNEPSTAARESLIACLVKADMTIRIHRKPWQSVLDLLQVDCYHWGPCTPSSMPGFPLGISAHPCPGLNAVSPPRLHTPVLPLTSCVRLFKLLHLLCLCFLFCRMRVILIVFK